MMNPQYMPPGQNNNAPNNPLGFTSSQDFNGHPNANIYGQAPSNGPGLPPLNPNPNDMAQKMQAMNITGPQGYSNVPPSQLPPGQGPPGGFPPTSNYGTAPTAYPPGRVPPQAQIPQAHQNLPGAVSHHGPMPPMSQAHDSRGYLPHQGQTPMTTTPQSLPKPNIPHQHPGQTGLPNSGFPQSGLPPQGLPGQHGLPNQQVGLPTSQPDMPKPGLPQQGMPTSQPSQQPGLPPQSVPTSQPGLPPQPNLPPQANKPSPPGAPQQPNFSGPGQVPYSQAPQQRPQSGFPHMAQPTMPPQSKPAQPGYQQGLPPQPGMNQSLPQQSGMAPQPGMPPHMGMPPQPGLSPQSVMSQGLPQQPGMNQGIPPQPGMIQSLPQAGMPPTSQYNQAYQQNTMPGLPHMPPPVNPQKYPGQPGYGQQPQPNAAYGGMPPMPQGPPSGYPAQFPGQQPPYPGQQPPFPGQQPSYPGQQYQQQPQKRLDPDQMPSPIQVMLDDQQNRGGIFVTNEKGLVPPLVTTDFVVDDKGNASPRYIRSSMYSVPATADMLKQTAMPFCLVISPLAETVGSEPEPPLLNFAALTGNPALGPVRCIRCKAYICPFMKFIDAGRHFKCVFCKATTEVPMEYTQYINSMQQYGRVPAEMALGTYEILATKEYCRENTMPKPPALVFVIDVSYNSIKNGLLQTLCDNILDIIEALPKDEQTGRSLTRVGFITYSTTVHFYNIKGTLSQPQMLSVGDVGDMFVPLLEGFLELPEDSGPVLISLLQQLPIMFQDNKETEIILLPAVQAGLEALKAAECAGQLLVFHTSLPTLAAPGKLINREDRKLLGTDKEKTILTPQNTEYNEVGQQCALAGVGVELFIANNSYVDTATIGQLARLTGGQVHKYTYFSPDIDAVRLARDVHRVISRPTGFDAVMRVRTSSGVRPTDFYGHLFMSNTTDVELAVIDADKAIGVEIKHDDKLTAEDGVYIQAAVLYTHRDGSRRLRILNLSLAVAHQLADAYRSVDTDTAVNVLVKQAVMLARESTPRQLAATLTARCARSLATYRRHCASPSAPGQLVLPESMKLLPLYTASLLRGDALGAGPDVTCDERACAMFRALAADVTLSAVYVYPRLLPLHDLDQGPAPIRATIDKMSDRGVYLLENGVHMLLWVGSQASPQFLQEVFGVSSPQQIDPAVSELPELDNDLNAAVRDIVEDARVKRRNAMRLTIMRQHDKLEAVLRHFLVEDRGVDGSVSYVDYLCHIHKEIRALL